MTGIGCIGPHHHHATPIPPHGHHICNNPVPAAWTQPINSTPTATVDPDQEPPW